MSERTEAIKQTLEAVRAQTRPLLERVTPEVLDRPSVGDANPKWKVRQVANHLASASESVVMLGERIRKGQMTNPPAILINAMGWWNQFKRAGRTPEQMLAEFDQGHQTLLAFVDRCSDADLDKKSVLPILGEASLETWFNVYGFHVATHAASIQSVLPPAPAPQAAT